MQISFYLYGSNIFIWKLKVVHDRDVLLDAILNIFNEE